VWIFVAFWGTLFQLAMSPFNWIDKVLEDVGEKVGKMLIEKASRGQTTRRAGKESIIEALKKKPSSLAVELVEPSKKTEDTVSLFEGKNTRV
jgi:hypothetical protein